LGRSARVRRASFPFLAEGRGRILDQRNVIAEEWTQVWDANERREYARLLANTNPHPLPRFRANGPLSNMAEFAKAFGCKKGDAMVREQACKIW